MAIKPKIENLIDMGNAVLSTQRETLTEVVEGLVDGYGQGGVPSIGTFETNNHSDNVLSLSNGYWIKVGAEKWRARIRNTESSDYVPHLNSLTSSYRAVVKFKPNSNSMNAWKPLLHTTTTADAISSFRLVLRNGQIGLGLRKSSNYWTYLNTIIEVDTWYYAVVYINKLTNFTTLSLYNESGELIEVKVVYNTNYPSNSYPLVFGGDNFVSTECWCGQIDFSECYIEEDSVAIWGNTNAKTQNMGIFSVPTNPSDVSTEDMVEVEYIKGTLAFNITPSSNFDEVRANLNASEKASSFFYNDYCGGKFKESWNPYPTNFRFNNTWTGNGIGNPSLNTNYSVKMIVKNENQKYYLNDSLIWSGTYSIDTSDISYFYFLCGNSSGSSEPFKGTLTGRTLFLLNDVVMYEFAPVRIKPFSNVFGIYDTINNKLYFSLNGNYEITAGNEISES